MQRVADRDGGAGGVLGGGAVAGGEAEALDRAVAVGDDQAGVLVERLPDVGDGGPLTGGEGDLEVVVGLRELLQQEVEQAGGELELGDAVAAGEFGDGLRVGPLAGLEDAHAAEGQRAVQLQGEGVPGDR